MNVMEGLKLTSRTSRGCPCSWLQHKRSDRWCDRLNYVNFHVSHGVARVFRTNFVMSAPGRQHRAGAIHNLGRKGKQQTVHGSIQ
jgi:hypothetical protein